MCRLGEFLDYHKLQKCGENAGFGGKCLTQLTIDELWRLFEEEKHIGNFERILPSAAHLKYFNYELSFCSKLAAQWSDWTRNGR